MKKIIVSIIISCSILISNSISEIRIIGNSITKNEIILREIQHPLNIEYSDSIRVEDQNRIYNLGIFYLAYNYYNLSLTMISIFVFNCFIYLYVYMLLNKNISS